ncbi:MAG: hypothetical protein FWF84_02890 [Kiritimatiellaeota bacterium]|nr:hypothetical protein [Kiritimatiellota bacterium]
MKVYVDFDDVIAETARTLAEVLWEATGRRVAYEEIHAFDLRVSFGLGEAEYVAFMEAAHRPRVLERIPPTPGACETLRRWREEGRVSPVVVTGRPASCHRESVAWLGRYGLGDIEIVHVDKYGRHGGECTDGVKTYAAEELAGMGFGVAIDDAPPALALLERWNVAPAIVFDRPWNRHYASPALCGRARDWNEVDDMIRKRL